MSTACSRSWPCHQPGNPDCRTDRSLRSWLYRIATNTSLDVIGQKALAAGVPACVVPFGRDQLEVARRVELCGAGTRLPAARLRPDRLRNAAYEAVALRAGAQWIAAAFRAAGGAPRPPDPSKLEAVSRQLLQEVKHLSALDLIAAFDAHNRVTRSVGAFFTDYDLLVTPTLGQLPVPHGTLQYDNPDHTMKSWLRSLFDYGPFHSGVQQLRATRHQPAAESQPERAPDRRATRGPYGREDLLLQVAAQLEHAMPWKHRTPPSFTGTR